MEWVAGNIFIRPTVLHRAGSRVDGHRHNFDHVTVVFRGAVHVRAALPDGTVVQREFHAPAHVLIRAQATHEITALVDDTEFWCIFSHRDAQGDVVQEYTGWTEAYR